MIILTLMLFILFDMTISNEKKTIPKLDIRDSDLVIDVTIDNLFSKAIDKGVILIAEQIEEIQKKSKEYNVLPIKETDIVIFETNLGTMKIKLFNDIAPNHCLNFKKLSNSGFYDDTFIFRVIPDFIIQGGDILTRDSIKENDGQGNPGWTINQEFNNKKHKKGIISMSRGSDINSAGSQFFICLGDAPHLDGKYTVFGEVVDNLNVLDVISAIPSESEKMIKMSKKTIPDNENIDNWIEYEFNERILFFKIPNSSISREDYREYINQRIYDYDRPSIPVKIKKIRVVNEQEIDKSNE